MRRREFIAFVGGAIGYPVGVRAQQQTGKLPRIGYLRLTSPSDRPPLLDTFRQALRELRWVEGQNIVIDYRFAEGRLDRLPDLAAELVRLKVDIIVSAGTQGVTAAKNATETIPIVMIGVRDPIGTGLIASLARPGGNVTGVSGSAGLEIVAKQLELLKETVPKIRRVGILSNPTNEYHQLAITSRPSRWECGFNSWRLEIRMSSTAHSRPWPKSAWKRFLSCQILYSTATKHGS